MGHKLPPPHPGEVLLDDFLVPTGISQYRLAKDICVSPRRVNQIVNGRRGITADTALRLARFFGTSAELWLNLQMQYDIETRRGEIKQDARSRATSKSSSRRSPDLVVESKADIDV
jgi:addiction module HigA family antidote